MFAVICLFAKNVRSSLSIGLASTNVRNARSAGKEAGEYSLLDRNGAVTDRAVRIGQLGRAMQQHRFELWEARKEPLVGVLFDWENEAVWALHERFGFKREALLRAHVRKAGVFRDVVICGEGQGALKVLAWPDAEGVRRLAGEAVERPGANAAVRAAVTEGLRRYNETHTGQSERLAGLLFLDTPPDIEGHEVSDKGSINRNMVLRNRAAEVARLYADDAEVIAP